MTGADETKPDDAKPNSRTALLRRFGPAAVLLVALAIVSALVIPRMHADGSARVQSYELDAGQPTPALRTQGAITRNLYGFVIGGFGSGSVAFDVTLSPKPGERTLLLVSGGGGRGVSTRLSETDSGGRHLLGHPAGWQSHAVDISSHARPGGARLVFTATNSSSDAQLIADRVQVVEEPHHAVPRAGRWEVAAWVALAVLLGLALLGRLRRDALLALAAGVTAYLVWPSATGSAFQPLFSDLWTPAAHAGWLDLDHGLLSGTFGAHSALAVQLFHAFTPITGTGDAGAHTASMLVGILALAAIYALGRRVAGAVGAVAGVVFALLADPFRLSLPTGDSTGTLVLAACLFVIAVHVVLTRRDRAAMVSLGAAGAVAILAEPLWWPGVLTSIALMALRELPSGQRLRALGAALAVLALLSLPSRVSLAHQSSGELNADVIERTTITRNIEFLGRDHGAPPDEVTRAADPAAGPRVGLGDYVLGDHSLTTAAGGVLSGAYDGLSAAAARTETGLAGLLAFIVGLVGAVLVLLVPRLRLLVVTPALLALVPWFFASRGGVAPFVAQTGFWPALIVGAATVAHMVAQVARGRVLSAGYGTHVAGRIAAVLRRNRSPQPG